MTSELAHLTDPVLPSDVAHMTSGPGFSKMLELDEPKGDRLVVAALLALAMHGALGLFALSRPVAVPVPPPPVDVELAFREPPPPPPEPPPLPEAPEPSKTVEPPKPVLAKLAPPPAARAGAVLTATPDPEAPASAEPFDFTSDPNGTVWGSGVVAVGGTASHGLAGARVGGQGTEPAATKPKGDGLTAVSDLSQRPRLREADPCRGFFPDTATDDVARVSVHVVIGKNGKVSSANIISESPQGQGFGKAARACMLSREFTPALDRQGNAAATALPVNVRFSR